MTGIVLSSAVRQNLLSLQSTATSLATTQNALSTGKKVNSALDNPTNFFTAQGLDNRASDISNLLDGISNGVQVLQAANTGLTSIESLVSQAKSIANQALQTSIGYSTKSSITSAAISGATASNLLGTAAYTSGTYTGTALTQAGSGSNAITGASVLSTSGSPTDAISGPTAGQSLTINGQTISFVASGGAATSLSATGSTINLGTGTVQNVLDAINDVAGAGTATIASGKIVLTSGTTSGITIGGTAATNLGLATGTSSSAGYGGSTISTTGTTQFGGNGTAIGTNNVLTIASTGGGTATNITFGTGAGQISTLDALNTALAANNLQATLSSAGALTITTTNDAASSTIGTVAGTVVSGSTGIFHSSTAPAAAVADAASQTTRSTLVSQYNAILTQIDNTASDSSYNGVNLLSGDQLQLTFNETGKSKLNITGVNDSSAGLGLSALTSGTDFVDNTATNKVLTTLNSVGNNLRSQASAFGSNLSVVQTRQDFNSNLINVLQTGSANLTQADINLEAANSQALQTRQSLSVSALSLANQAQQSVLQLLR